MKKNQQGNKKPTNIPQTTRNSVLDKNLVLVRSWINNMEQGTDPYTSATELLKRDLNLSLKILTLSAGVYFDALENPNNCALYLAQIRSIHVIVTTDKNYDINSDKNFSLTLEYMVSSLIALSVNKQNEPYHSKIAQYLDTLLHLIEKRIKVTNYKDFSLEYTALYASGNIKDQVKKMQFSERYYDNFLLLGKALSIANIIISNDIFISNTEKEFYQNNRISTILAYAGAVTLEKSKFDDAALSYKQFESLRSGKMSKQAASKIKAFENDSFLFIGLKLFWAIYQNVKPGLDNTKIQVQLRSFNTKFPSAQGPYNALQSYYKARISIIAEPKEDNQMLMAPKQFITHSGLDLRELCQVAIVQCGNSVRPNDGILDQINLQSLDNASINDILLLSQVYLNLMSNTSIDDPYCIQILENLECASRIHADSEAILDMRLNIYVTLGKFDECNAILKQLDEFRKNDPSYQYFKFVILYISQRIEPAIEALSMAISLDPKYAHKANNALSDPKSLEFYAAHARRHAYGDHINSQDIWDILNKHFNMHIENAYTIDIIMAHFDMKTVSFERSGLIADLIGKLFFNEMARCELSARPAEESKEQPDIVVHEQKIDASINISAKNANTQIIAGSEAVDHNNYKKVITQHSLKKLQKSFQAAEDKKNGVPEIHVFSWKIGTTDLTSGSKDVYPIKTNACDNAYYAYIMPELSHKIKTPGIFDVMQKTLIVHGRIVRDNGQAGVKIIEWKKESKLVELKPLGYKEYNCRMIGHAVRDSHNKKWLFSFAKYEERAH